MSITEICESDLIIKPTIRNYADGICSAMGMKRKADIYEILNGNEKANRTRYFDVREWTLLHLPCQVYKLTKIKVER